MAIAVIPIQLRRGTLAQWQSANPILRYGEYAVVLTDSIGEFPEGVLIGNGVDDFNTLWSNTDGIIRPFVDTQNAINTLSQDVKKWFDIPTDTGQILSFNAITNELEPVVAGVSGQFLMRDDNAQQGLVWTALPVYGDMLKSVYDTDDNGIVDSAEREQIAVKNMTGATLSKGTIVYIDSASTSAQYPEVLKASAAQEPTSSKTIGAIYEDISNGDIGYIVTSGQVHNLNTSAFNVGDKLWLSTTAGQVTTTPPTQPNHTVFIGHVTRKQNNNGRILYAIQNGYELQEMHDVLISNPQPNDILTYDSVTGLWKNETLPQSGESINKIFAHIATY
jgi:hypothetical protein